MSSVCIRRFQSKFYVVRDCLVIIPIIVSFRSAVVSPPPRYLTPRIWSFPNVFKSASFLYSLQVIQLFCAYLMRVLRIAILTLLVLYQSSCRVPLACAFVSPVIWFSEFPFRVFCVTSPETFVEFLYFFLVYVSLYSLDILDLTISSVSSLFFYFCIPLYFGILVHDPFLDFDYEPACCTQIYLFPLHTSDRSFPHSFTQTVTTVRLIHTLYNL